MPPRLLLITALLLAPLATVAQDAASTAASFVKTSRAAALPFDRERINRYSLDHLPRSLSIRQGEDVWLGYDLERGKIYKVWQAAAGKPGLIASGFVTKSAGIAWFEDKSSESWQLQREGKAIPLQVRYLGCAQRETYFELAWELRHAAGAVKLLERIPLAAAPAAGRATRELRVESMAAGETLLPPPAAGKSWQQAGRPADALTGTDWHRLIFP